MPHERYRFALELLVEEGRSLGRNSVEVDWEPAKEWAQLAALRESRDPASGGSDAHRVEPCWNPELGRPYVSGFNVRGEVTGDADDAGSPLVEIPITYLNDAARELATLRATEGKLETDATFSFRVLAFLDRQDPDEAPGMEITVLPAIPVIGEGKLAELEARSDRKGMQSDEDVPVFIPAAVLGEASRQSRASAGTETGGILIGHLLRDPATGDLFARVSAQIKAEHTEASESSLGFTAATWMDVQNAIELRNKNEIMLGWWHLHPVKEWCADCPAEKRKDCTTFVDYFSKQDRLLHRAVFPAAYSVALVISALADDSQSVALFGWRRGSIKARGFHFLREEPDSTAPRADRTLREETP